MSTALDWKWLARPKIFEDVTGMTEAMDFRRYWKLELFISFAAACGMARASKSLQQAIFPDSEPESQLQQFSRYKNDGKPKSALLHQRAAAEINEYLARAVGVDPPSLKARVEAADLESARFMDFARKLGSSVESAPRNGSRLAQDLQASTITLVQPKPSAIEDGAQLSIKRHPAGDRFIADFSAPSNDPGEPFKPGDQIEVRLTGAPSGELFLFTFITRDASLHGASTSFAWVAAWGDFIRWAKSPQRVTSREMILVVPRTDITPLAGRYELTVVVVSERPVAAALAPSGSCDRPTVPDEDQHLHFLRILADIRSKQPSAIKVLRAGYTISME